MDSKPSYCQRQVSFSYCKNIVRFLHNNLYCAVRNKELPPLWQADLYLNLLLQISLMDAILLDTDKHTDNENEDVENKLMLKLVW